MVYMFINKNTVTIVNIYNFVKLNQYKGVTLLSLHSGVLYYCHDKLSDNCLINPMKY